MTLALIFMAILATLELLLYIPLIWKFKRYIASVLLVSISIASGSLVASDYAAWQFLLLGLSIYRIINLLRVIENRPHNDYLYHEARRASLWLIGGQIVISLIAFLTNQTVSSNAWLLLLAVGQLVAASVLALHTFRQLRTMRPVQPDKKHPNRDLPSLTVAIPARNETAELEACLTSLVGGTYPKLEILVLDDCSQERRTPEIIRQYAHDGVRFIAGTPAPSDHWLAKNHAYDQLAHEANGEYILFCGVDTTFAVGSLHAAVESLLASKVDMVSFLPANQLSRGFSLESIAAQSSRYAWEVILPRNWRKHPPVLSTVWLIKKDALKSAGGFKAVTRSILPERYFAAACSNKRGYQFLAAGKVLGVTTHKTSVEQRATAIRTRYPALHKRPELAALCASGNLLFMAGPYAVLLLAAIAGEVVVLGVSAVTLLLLAVTYGALLRIAYGRYTILALVLPLLSSVYDSFVLTVSMWRYEFREVIWKERNVCVPVMHVTPHLPKLD